MDDKPYILWIAPNLNHYNARFLHRLVERTGLRITVYAGQQQPDIGHRPHEGVVRFATVVSQARKGNFSFRLSVFRDLWRLVRSGGFDVVLMPLEIKHLPIILYLFTMQSLFGYHLVTYNHPLSPGRGSVGRLIHGGAARLLFGLYDRVIFYTEKARDEAVARRCLPVRKAFFANNTLDTDEIWQDFEFQVNTSEPKVLLFIGRLMPNKRWDLLLKYYESLKELLPGLRLNIIGDGPEAPLVREAAAADPGITWQGAVVNEAAIRAHMAAAHLVLVPGDTGLSIVHAFAYGKPYVTLPSLEHGPEIAYLLHGANGLMLSGEIWRDRETIASLLRDDDRYAAMCRAAFETAQGLSIEHWCRAIEAALDFLRT